MPRVLLCQTSATMLGEHPTGSWWEEMTAPYYVFREAGFDVTIASVKGGQVVFDKGSEAMATDSDKRFWAENLSLIQNVPSFSQIIVSDYDAVFFSGGHGTVVDFEEGAKKLVEDFYRSGKFIAAVCHGPTALVRAEVNGQRVIKGKRVTGFSNKEEDTVGLTGMIKPKWGLLADNLKAAGGLYEDNGQEWVSHAVRDGQIITGQNPQSSKDTA